MSPALASLPPHVRAAVLEAKAGLEAVYGDRLARVVLYGSYARGEAGPDSDVDLLVVLRGEYRPHIEIKRRLVPIALEALDRHGVHVSLQPYAAVEVEDRRRPFMRNVSSDGLEV